MNLSTYQSKLATLRQEAKLSQAQLAVFVGVTTNTVQNWEKPDGLNQFVKFLKLCEILGCDPHDLINVNESQDNQEREFTFEDLKKIRESWGTGVRAKTNKKSKTSLNKEKNTG
jgi:transcriptional regulator with XRE-family HTH domain